MEKISATLELFVTILVSKMYLLLCHMPVTSLNISHEHGKVLNGFGKLHFLQMCS